MLGMPTLSTFLTCAKVASLLSTCWSEGDYRLPREQPETVPAIRRLSCGPEKTAMSSLTLQTSGMLSKEQLIHLFKRFSYLTSQPDVKNRIADAVKDKQEAVAITTAVQEEILLEMGVDPRFGIACLGKVGMVYENDRDLMIQFYSFVAKEEMACDEAELEPKEFEEKILAQQELQKQQLEMLKHMRKFNQDDQSAIIEARSMTTPMTNCPQEVLLHEQMEDANFDNNAAVLSHEQIEEVVCTRTTPLTK